jgi:hypothetical protein
VSKVHYIRGTSYYKDDQMQRLIPLPAVGNSGASIDIQNHPWPNRPPKYPKPFPPPSLRLFTKFNLRLVPRPLAKSSSLDCIADGSLLLQRRICCSHGGQRRLFHNDDIWLQFEGSAFLLFASIRWLHLIHNFFKVSVSRFLITCL